MLLRELPVYIRLIASFISIWYSFDVQRRRGFKNQSTVACTKLYSTINMLETISSKKQQDGVVGAFRSLRWP